jgi:hypothetical protein
MQARHFDGSYGPIEPLTEEGLKRTLAMPNVQHVEVFEGTEENIKARQRLLGVKKRYQKAPKNKKR